MNTIAFFTGTADAFNIQCLIKNIDRILGEEFILDLITTNPDSFDVTNFTKFGEGGDSRIAETRSLRDYTKNRSPEVLVQLTQPPIHGTICGLEAKKNNIQFIYRYNGDTFGEYKLMSGLRKFRDYTLYNLIGRIPIHLSDRCVVMGENGRDTISNLGVSEKKINILPPMIDVSRFRIDEKEPIRDHPNQTIVGFVGRVSYLKGVETLKNTIGKIRDFNENIKFVLVGPVVDSSLREIYPDTVEFIGPVPPEDIPRYMNSFDVLVHPSLTEGIPRVLLEALSAGTPVVARDVGDIPAVTQNTFDTDDEFVDIMSDIDKLSVEPIERFSVDSLKEDYQKYFHDVIGRS